MKRATKTTHTTRFETLLQKELKSDVARYVTHVPTGLSTNQVVSGCKKLLQKVEGSFTFCNKVRVLPAQGPVYQKSRLLTGPR